jgi:hypothetical protein
METPGLWRFADFDGSLAIIVSHRSLLDSAYLHATPGQTGTSGLVLYAVHDSGCDSACVLAKDLATDVLPESDNRRL